MIRRNPFFDTTEAERFGTEILTCDEPTRHAGAMLAAVEKHLLDLRDDDPVSEEEGLTPQEIRRALDNVTDALNILQAAYRRWE